MEAFLVAITSFPTVVYTVGVGISLVYWLTVMLGALDLELLDFGDAQTSEAGEVDAGSGAAWLSVLRIGRVPLTITLSLQLLTAWTLSGLTMLNVPSALREGSLGTLFSVLTLALSYFVAVKVTRLLARPLVPVFDGPHSVARQDLIGAVVRVDTGTVDEGFGYATHERRGQVRRIQIRCAPELGLKRGDQALIVGFDSEREAFEVEPMSAFLPAPGAKGSE